MSRLLDLWDELRNKPGPYHLVMRGWSMWPAVPEGSILAVEPCAPLAPGDMVTFRRDRQIVTHRVVGVGRDGLVRAWGDSVLRPDAPIEAGDVLGRATVFRRGRLIVDWRTGYVAMLRLGAAIARRRTAR